MIHAVRWSCPDVNVYQVSVLAIIHIVRKRPKCKWLTLIKLLKDTDRNENANTDTYLDYDTVGIP